MESELTQTYVHIDLTKFTPEEHLKDYHFFAPYDPNKVYETEPYTANFGKHGDLTYRNMIYTINGQYKFIVAEEELSREDTEKLKPYCQCEYHKRYWFNPMRIFICQCCVGCLHSGMPQQYVINRAREAARIAELNRDLDSSDSSCSIESTDQVMSESDSE